MVEITSVTLVSDRRGWAVDLALKGRRELRRYRYDNEAQARFFAAVFTLNPSTLPEGHVRVRRAQSTEATAPVGLPASLSHESIEAAIAAKIALLGNEDALARTPEAAARDAFGALDEDDLERAFGELELGLCG